MSSAATLKMAVPREILVIKPSSLGDVVHTLPAVARLKKHWPGSHLRWLINAEWAPLLDHNPYVDETLIFPRRDFRGLRGALRIAPWARAFRERVHADLIVDFQGLLRSALVARLCRGGRVAGLSDSREGARFLYDEIADVEGVKHAVDRYLRLVVSLGVESAGPLDWPLPEGIAPGDFAVTKPFVLLHPFARGTGKSLDDADVAEFCRSVSPVAVVVVGRRDGYMNDSAISENVTDLVNRTTLLELIWLIRQATFVLSVDSGPMHIAAAITSRLLSIHTWSDPLAVGPYHPDAWVWRNQRICRVRDLQLLAHHIRVPGIAALAAWLGNELRGEL